MVAQVIKDAHGVFRAFLDAEETLTKRNSKNILQAVLCFLWAAADGCLPAWESPSKPDKKELFFLEQDAPQGGPQIPRWESQSEHKQCAGRAASIRRLPAACAEH